MWSISTAAEEKRKAMLCKQSFLTLVPRPPFLSKLSLLLFVFEFVLSPGILPNLVEGFGCLTISSLVTIFLCEQPRNIELMQSYHLNSKL